MSRHSRFLTGSALDAICLHIGQRSLIKSIQVGTVTHPLGNATATATITGVNISNAVIFSTGYTSDDVTDSISSGAGSLWYPQLALTNTTTVTSTRTGTGGTGNLLVGFVVIEFFPGVVKSFQQGSITIGSGNTTNTATITTVNTAKSFVTISGVSASGAAIADVIAKHFVGLALTNATTVTASRGASGTFTATVQFQVIEFY